MAGKRKFIVPILLLLWITGPLHSQTFKCDGSLLVSTHQGTDPTATYKTLFAPFGVITFSQLSVFRDGPYDAMGFNSTDNYIYAVRVNTNQIVRLKSDGSAETIGSVPFVDTLHVGAGDCTPDGRYLCFDNQLDQLLVFDVTNNFELIDRIDFTWDPSSVNSGPFTTRIDDLAVDPNNPLVAYTFQGDYNNADLQPDLTRGYMHRINIDFNSPDLGVVTPLLQVPPDVANEIGSLFFDGGGRLFGYGKDNRGFTGTGLQNKLILFDVFSGNITPYQYTGPGGAFTDGCSCPYGVYFGNNVFPRDALCTNSSVTIDLSISNGYFYPLEGLEVTDTLPEGMFVEAFLGDWDGDIAPGTGVGTRIVDISGIQVPPRGSVTISVKARIEDIDIQFIENQAFLRNLPALIGDEMVSDDPATMGFVGDPTTFFATAQVMDEFEAETTPAEDCLDAYSGSMTLSSPVLIRGAEYSVSMRNEEYDVFSWDVSIDDQNTFFIDSMPPGDYELFKITPLTSKCSFAMKDTTINVMAPNHLLEASASSNSPVCEDETLELFATSSPPGTYKWEGPLDYNSKEQNLVFEDSRPNQSGEFEVTVKYGFCKQVRTLDVLVNPEVDAAIDGRDVYCERDTLLLIGEGEGEQITYSWTGPNGFESSDQNAFISSLVVANGGDYEVFMDNGSCRDTAMKTIVVNPSPLIDMPELIETRFCEPLLLRPQITNDANLDYSWQPQEGLNCADCPNPELVLPVQPEFKLNVENEFSCRDSAEVAVELIQDRLIYIPNAFSPNFDRINEEFTLSPGCGLRSIVKFEIFDRWGNRVHLEGPRNDLENKPSWDGKIDGKVAMLGVYFYFLEVELVDGSTRKYRGDFSLFK